MGLQEDLYLWLLFQEHADPPCEMTERRIFTMANQVASALVSTPTYSIFKVNLSIFT